MPNTGMRRAVEDLADRLDGVAAGLGVARPVGEKNAVRLHSQDLACRRLRRHDGHPGAAFDDEAQDVALDAVVVGDDVELELTRAPVPFAEFPTAFAPLVGLRHRNDLGEIHPGETGKRFCFAQRLLDADLARRGIASGDETAVLRALFAQQAGELARVDVGDPTTSFFFK